MARPGIQTFPRNIGAEGCAALRCCKDDEETTCVVWATQGLERVLDGCADVFEADMDKFGRGGQPLLRTISMSGPQTHGLECCLHRHVVALARRDRVGLYTAKSFRRTYRIVCLRGSPMGIRTIAKIYFTHPPAGFVPSV